MYFEVAKIYSKNKSSLCEIVRNVKETHASFAVASQNVKVKATMCDKCLIKMGRPLNLWVEYMNRKCVQNIVIVPFIVNFPLLFLNYKVTFIIERYLQEMHYRYMVFYFLWFQASSGDLGMCAP